MSHDRYNHAMNTYKVGDAILYRESGEDHPKVWDIGEVIEVGFNRKSNVPIYYVRPKGTYRTLRRYASGLQRMVNKRTIEELCQL